jgi:multicomponent Na+:H+ antiporter subunit D
MILLAGAILIPLLPRAARSWAFLIFPAAAFMYMAGLPDGNLLTFRFASFDLSPVYADRLSRMFGGIFALITLIGGVYGLHNRNTGEKVAALVYAGASLNVTFAGDFISLFLFWEMMALSSAYLIWARGTAESYRAGLRYIIMHVTGGTILLGGIILYLEQSGTFLIHQFQPNAGFAPWVILAGLSLNAAVLPLHAWLPDSYPKASITGAVFMSALTTKVGVYVLARMFPGWEILTVLGVAMTLYGVVFAILSNDIRGVLAYHIISQVGFMVAGVGLGTEMSVNGATAHAVSHILYKALLFMAAGAVIQSTGISKLSDLGGLLKSQPVLFALFMIGALSISGMPLFNGFVSKQMTIAAAVESHRYTVMMLMELASVGTFLSIALKISYLVWFGPNRGIKPSSIPLNMYIGMGLAAALCIAIGVWPTLLYQYLPFTVRFEPYTAALIVEAVQLLLFTFFGFWIIREQLVTGRSIALDVDWLYRKAGPILWKWVVVPVDNLFTSADERAMEFAKRLSQWGRNPTRPPVGTAELAEYDPNRYRPLTQSLVTLVLLLIITIAVWVVLLAAR